MMEENNLDPKIIEAAKIRMENDDSESDDSILLDKEEMKKRVVKKRLNLSDKFFRGDDMIKKPPVNPYSFYTYENFEEAGFQPRKRKKKRKKKRSQPQMDPNALLKLLQAQ